MCLYLFGLRIHYYYFKNLHVVLSTKIMTYSYSSSGVYEPCAVSTILAKLLLLDVVAVCLYIADR